MDLWSYLPQTVYAEDVRNAVAVTPIGGQSDVAGAVTENRQRVFTLQYTVVPSGDLQNMRNFFRTHRTKPFGFVNPLDGKVYQVRFDPAIRPRLFTPIFFQLDGVRLWVVNS